MMSGKDGPFVSTAEVTMATAATKDTNTENINSDDSDMKQVWRFIYVDLAFVKSINGIFLAAEVVLSLLGLISVTVPKNEGCADLYGNSYSLYEFVASSVFITSLVFYFLYLLAITKKLGFIRWDITEGIWCLMTALLYFICSLAIAGAACSQDGYVAAAVFGFLNLGVIIPHGVMQGCSVHVRSVLEKRNAVRGSSASDTADVEANNYKDTLDASSSTTAEKAHLFYNR